MDGNVELMQSETANDTSQVILSVDESTAANDVATEENVKDSNACDDNKDSSNIQTENPDINSNGDATDMHNDKYAYTKTERFTSEIFKIEIGNLPKFFGFGECKKLLTKKLKLKPHKVKIVKHINKAYVTFKNEDDKTEAVEKLKEYQHKGKKFSVKNAKPIADAMAGRKRTLEMADEAPVAKQNKDNSHISCEELLKNSVIPWWEKPYPEQLQEKQNVMLQSLIEFRKQLCAVDHLDVEVFRWLMKQKKESNGCCPAKPILPSPVTSEYRNKCGFTIGKDLNGEVDIGFRLGKYREQTCAVASSNCLVHVPDRMKRIVSCLVDFVRRSKLVVYDKQVHKGHWRQLTLRTSTSNTVMAVIAISKQQISDQELIDEQQALLEHFKASDVCPDTVLFRTIVDESNSNIESAPAVTAHGDGVIYEDLFDLKFRISPTAFFQCNTLAAQVLYDCVKSMVLKQVDSEGEFTKEEAKDASDVVLLDVCCGTGTIGLCLAKSVGRVIGIDICQEAIEDAKMNAKINNIENVQFYCNKAEDQLPDLIHRLSSTSGHVIAVVDPPRCGLHQKVVKAIRQCPLIQKLVYVSCSADQARTNFVDLCRPQSKRTLGLAFKPVLAQPIDLFPHAAHCELVMLFERITATPTDHTSTASSTSSQTTPDNQNESLQTPQISNPDFVSSTATG